MGGDLSFAAMQSLKSIDDWIATLNGNMAGSARVGYKASRVTFKGGVANVMRAGTGGMLPLQFPEANLSDAGTSIDFSQGSIVASTEKTHFAIQGKGFFVLTDNIAGGNIFYSRDGEFHLDSSYHLCNSQGLYLIRAGAAGTVSAAITIDPTASEYDPLTGVGFLPTIATEPLYVQTIANLTGLKFSKYGSTVFESGGSLTITGRDGTSVVQQSLEASNASLTQLVPELSLAQKMFTAISKVLQVNFTNIDTILNLIR